MPTHRFVALKCISVLEKARAVRACAAARRLTLFAARIISPQDKRQQLLNELRLMCDGSTAHVRGVVAYIGTYYVPEHNTVRRVVLRRGRVTGR